MTQTIALSLQKILDADNKTQLLSLINKIQQNSTKDNDVGQSLIISMIYRLNNRHDDADKILNQISNNTTKTIEDYYYQQYQQIIENHQEKQLIIDFGQRLLRQYTHNIDIFCLFLTYLFSIGYYQELLNIAFKRQQFFTHDNSAPIMRLIAKSFLHCGVENLYYQWSHDMIAQENLDFIAVNDLALHHRDQLRYKESRHYFLYDIKDVAVDGLFIKNRGLNNLLHEQYQQGWREYNHRFDAEDYSLSYMPFKLPIWQGEDLNHKKIIILSEQGYGDNIQLARLLKLLIITYPNAHIYAICWQNLKNLFDYNMPDIHWIDFPKQQPACDYQIPVFNLPEILNINADTIPFTQGYLSPPPAYIHKWQEVLQPFQAKKQKNYVLCWHTHNDKTEKNKLRVRSIILSDFAALLAIPNINFHLISPYIDPSDENLLMQYGIIDHRQNIKDFSDSAAIISLCDGVITIDTAMAHLAGALGQKTALILPLINDWRWSLYRQHSIWYDSIRIYRQRQRHNYSDIIQRLRQDMRHNFFINHKIYQQNPRLEIETIIRQGKYDEARDHLLDYIAFLKKYHDPQIAQTEIKHSILLLHHICLRDNDPYLFLEICLDFIRKYGVHHDIVNLYLPILYQCGYEEHVIDLCSEIAFDYPDTACAYWQITGNQHLSIDFFNRINRICVFYIADFWFNAITYFLTQKNHQDCVRFVEYARLEDNHIKQDILWQYLYAFLMTPQSQEKFYALYCLLQEQYIKENNPILYYHCAKLTAHIIISHDYHHLPLLPILYQPITSRFLWYDYFKCPIKSCAQWHRDDIILLYDHTSQTKPILFNKINDLFLKVKAIYIITYAYLSDDLNKIFVHRNITYIHYQELLNLNPKPTALGDIDDVIYHSEKHLNDVYLDWNNIVLPKYKFKNKQFSLFNIGIMWHNDHHYYQQSWQQSQTQYDIKDIVGYIIQKKLPLHPYMTLHLLNPNPQIEDRRKIIDLKQEYGTQIIDHSLAIDGVSTILHIARECDVIITIDGDMASLLALCDKAMFILHNNHDMNIDIKGFCDKKYNKPSNYLKISHLSLLQRAFYDMYQHNITHLALKLLEKYAEEFVQEDSNHNDGGVAALIDEVAQQLETYMNKSQSARLKHIQAVYAQSKGNHQLAYDYYQESLFYEETAMCYRNFAIIAPEFHHDQHYIVSLLNKAIDLDDDVPNIYQNLGYQYSDMGFYHESLTCFEKEYEKSGDNRGNLCNLAVAYLKLQRYEQGFAYYHKMRQLFRDDKYKPKTDKPFWQGQDLKGKSLLVQCEQGHGDNLCYSRFIENVKNLGAKVILVTYDNLISLYQDNPMIDAVVLRDDEALPHHDYWVMVIDLLIDHYHRFKEITPKANYIAPNKKRVGVWKRRINKITQKNDNKLRIGLCWASHNFPIEQRRRALPIQDAKRLINIKNHDLFSLQVGARERDLSEDKAFDRLHNLAPQLFNFEETAAAILQLDLVISVDTAVAHLAGALGKPVWLMLPVGCDWRYLQIDAKDTQNLWYIDLKIFRQKQLNDWSDVIKQIKRALKKITNMSPPALS